MLPEGGVEPVGDIMVEFVGVDEADGSVMIQEIFVKACNKREFII